MPPAPPPLIDRIVGHPLVRSGYASILAHLAIAIVLAILASRENPPPRPPPLLLAFGDDHLRDADDDAIQMDRAVELAPLDAPADAGGDRDDQAKDSPANGTSATMRTGISDFRADGRLVRLVPRFPMPNQLLLERLPSPLQWHFSAVGAESLRGRPPERLRRDLAAATAQRLWISITCSSSGDT